MYQWALKPNGRVVPRRTARTLNDYELCSEVEIRKRKKFDSLIEGKLGTSMIPPKEEIPEFKEYEDDDEIAITIPENEDATDANGRFINQQPAYDNIINSEVQLPIGGGISLVKLKQLLVAPDGTTTGEYSYDPFMNLIVY